MGFINKRQYLIIYINKYYYWEQMWTICWWL